MPDPSLQGNVPAAASSVTLRQISVLLCTALLCLALVIGIWVSAKKHCAAGPCTGTFHTKLPAPAARAIPPLPVLPGREPTTDNASAYGDIPPDKARAINAATAFLKGPIAVARPFHFVGSAQDRARAVDCLSAAMLYEAGLQATDQKAVAQVVLNRVRHPAFPHSVCAVVFEGAERQTGCQFTFTCDGSLARTYSETAWIAARALAERMLSGEVDKRVGWATHYHTDWVYPYWSPSLDKVSAVGAHLFFRWRGFWGTRTAFASGPTGLEPSIAALARFARPGLPDGAVALDYNDVAQPPSSPDQPLPPGVAPDALHGNQLKLLHPDGGSYGLLLKPGTSAKELQRAAEALCQDQAVCQVMAWSSAADIPRGFPIPPAAVAKLRYSFMRDARYDMVRYRYDCSLLHSDNPRECM